MINPLSKEIWPVFPPSHNLGIIGCMKQITDLLLKRTLDNTITWSLCNGKLESHFNGIHYSITPSVVHEGAYRMQLNRFEIGYIEVKLAEAALNQVVASSLEADRKSELFDLVDQILEDDENTAEAVRLLRIAFGGVN